MPSDIITDPEKRLLLFDGHALAFHSWFTSFPNQVTSGFFSMVKDAVRRHAPTHMIVTFDPAPPTFRHKLYPEYKAHRPPVPEGLLEDCDRVLNRLESIGVMCRTVQGYEADDLLGTLASKANKSGFETTIVTSDLDILQLVTQSTKVEVFSQYRPTRFFDIEETKRRFYGLPPKAIPDYKALAGDKSDNLPGVPGIGEISAATVLRQYGGLSETYEHIDSIKDLPFRGAKRVGRLLAEHRDQAFLMLTLTTIACDVPVDVDIDATEVQELLI